MGILGIDPGTLKMGYAVIGEGPNPHADDYGVISLPSKMPLPCIVKKLSIRFIHSAY